MTKKPDFVVSSGDTLLADSIGSLFMNFALFDYRLNAVIAAQLRLNELQARALVVPMQPRQKIEMIQWYTKQYWTKEKHEPVKELCSRAKALADFRNDVAHGHMVTGEGGKGMNLVTYGGPRRFQPKVVPFDTPTVAQTAMNALYLSEEFREFAETISSPQSDLPPPEGQPPH